MLKISCAATATITNGFISSAAAENASFWLLFAPHALGDYIIKSHLSKTRQTSLCIKEFWPEGEVHSRLTED